MSNVYDIWLYPLQDWWRTVDEMSDFMSTGQMGNFIFRLVANNCIVVSVHKSGLELKSSLDVG